MGRALKLDKVIRRPLREETRTGRQRASPSAWPVTPAPQSGLPSVYLVSLVSSVFCQLYDRYPKRVTIGHTLIQSYAWSLV